MENDIEVELTTGEILVFPEGTEQTTMKQALDNYLSKNPTSNTIQDTTPQQESGGFVDNLIKELPQAVGGIGGGILGAAKGARFGPVGVIVGGAAGAGLLGGTGKGFQQVYQYFTGDPNTPKTSKEAAVGIAKAAGEEAAWDLGGNLALKSLGKLFHLVRPKAVDDISRLSMKLEEKGGQFTASQRTDSWIVHQLDSLTRGSLTGSGDMKKADVRNANALKLIESELSTKVAKNATQHLSDTEVGSLFLNTLAGGKDAHKVVVGEMYSGLDDLVPTTVTQRQVAEEVPTGGINPATGVPGTKTIIKTVDDVLKPVKTNKLKEALTPYRNLMEEIKWQGVDPDSKQLIEQTFKQDETLSFGNAQALRSNLLDAQRTLEKVTGKTKASGKLNIAVNELTKAMDMAALQQSPETLAKYKKIKKLARDGFEVFNEKFISDLITANKTNPERIGEYIFRTGNVEEIMKAKRAVRLSAKYTGQSSDAVWNQMQKGYLDTLLRRSSTTSNLSASATTESVVGEGLDVSGSKLIKEFTDPKKARTLEAVFGKKTRDEILDFALTAERVQRRPEGGLGMLIQLTQGSAILAVAGGAFDPSVAGTTLITPLVLAKMMTSKGGAKMLATALKTPEGSKAASLIGIKLAKLVADATKEDTENLENTEEQ